MYSKQAKNLLQEQIQEWTLAGNNYAGLAKVQNRIIHYDNFDVQIQFNPERIRSSSAKVDKKSIEKRPCFLCADNRPSVQKGIPILDEHVLLINPFPIFPIHLTIPTIDHIDQLILEKFEDMLELSAQLKDFILFYNGPKCGASAPDHFHFQAGHKGFIPIEKDFALSKKVRLVSNNNGVEIYTWHHYLRKVITFKSTDKQAIYEAFMKLYSKQKQLQPSEIEPLMNILSAYYSKEWHIHIFPRKLHRPLQYYAKDDSQILLSPGSVDMGGICITPREEDFNKITKTDISNIFEQVCVDDDIFGRLVEVLCE